MYIKIFLYFFIISDWLYCVLYDFFNITFASLIQENILDFKMSSEYTENNNIIEIRLTEFSVSN